MDESSAEKVVQLEVALKDAKRQRVLLQQPEKLKEIMNDVAVRQWLFEQACQIDNCAQATKARLLIIRIMQSSGQLWRGRDGISLEVYEEALTRTWEWFGKNFDSYIPESASFVTWFNNYLKWRIADVQREIDREQQRRQYPYLGENGEAIDPLDLIPASAPDCWEKTVAHWLMLVQNDELLRSYRMQNAPHVNGQTLLAHILQELQTLGEFSWQTIAQTYEVEPSSLKRFCRIRCFPRFKHLCE